ncbi:MAG: hypothetical protein KGS10_15045 [Chloroflexi bacterium]|nr:hypothetical protein [Chloroflexota bacterium]
MLSATNFPLTEAARLLAQAGIEAALFVPTATGLRKSILDAHAGVRGYLLEAGFHDFDVQTQGPTHRKLVHCTLFEATSAIETTASLYRPITKTGDPRFWISKLGTYAAPNDLVAIAVDGERLVGLNLSRPEIRAALADSKSALRQEIGQLHARRNANEHQLLTRLRDIASAGFVRTRRVGDTGVGFTLEQLLGIKANSSRTPDFLGIEIKSSRIARRGAEPRTRTTLFAQTPDWSRSALDAVGLLTTYGYQSDTGRLQLYCTLNPTPNSLGLFLQVNDQSDNLDARYRPIAGPDRDAVLWGLANLRAALRAKHRQTAWVKAEYRGTGTNEEFRYVEVKLTQHPIASNLTPLLVSGAITVDLLMHELPASRGGIRVKDHGYLFKIRPSEIASLFPRPRTVTLIDS